MPVDTCNWWIAELNETDWPWICCASILEFLQYIVLLLLHTHNLDPSRIYLNSLTLRVHRGECKHFYQYENITSNNFVD